MNSDDKLEQIYLASQRYPTRGKAPTVEDLDADKLDYLVNRISTQLDEQWLNRTPTMSGYEMNFWVDSRDEKLTYEFFEVENKDGEEWNCQTEYFEEACSRVSALKQGDRFKLGWNVASMDERVQINWYVTKVH